MVFISKRILRKLLFDYMTPPSLFRYVYNSFLHLQTEVGTQTSLQNTAAQSNGGKKSTEEQMFKSWMVCSQ